MSISSFTVKGKTKIKIVLLGDQNVGKTSTIERYIHDRFDESENPTIGIDFVVSNVQQNNKNYRLQLWDTAGQERFKSLIPSYLKDSNCAIVLYDVANKESSQSVFKWLEMYQEHKDQSAFSLVVGNKIDLKTRFSNQQQMKAKCEKQRLHYRQISAKTGENVKELFLTVIDIVEEQSKKNILGKDIFQSQEKIDSPKKTPQLEEGYTAGVIKLNNDSKVEEKQPSKQKNNCC